MFYRNKTVLNKVPKNPLLLRFFKSYPKSHILKFFISRKLHRIVNLFILKLIYWFLFKVVYRLELEDINKLIIKNKEYSNEPFLIVQNHCSSRDVILLMSIWAHFNRLPGVLVSSIGFSIKKPCFVIFSHFFEQIPHYGTGIAIIKNITERLLMGDIVAIFPEGSQPDGEYKNSGLVQEMFTGVARVAYEYQKITGKKLNIQPSCTIGANNVFPPRATSEKIRKTKIILKFGEPFSLKFSDNVNFDEIKEKTEIIALKIANIWNQKKLIKNYGFDVKRSFFEKSGKYRMYHQLKR